MSDYPHPCVKPGRIHTGFESGADPLIKCADCMSPDCPVCGVRGVEGTDGVWYCNNPQCENRHTPDEVRCPKCGGEARHRWDLDGEHGKTYQCPKATCDQAFWTVTPVGDQETPQ